MSIQDRLRESAGYIESAAPGDNAGDSGLCIEAADAIDELLSAIQKLMQHSDHHTGEVCTDSGLGSYVQAKLLVERLGR